MRGILQLSHKPQQTDGFADIAMPVQSADDFSDIAKPHVPVTEFAAPKDNKEGIYRMKSPDGTDVQVPYSKVMLASKAGYKIHPNDRTKYADDYVDEMRKKAFVSKFAIQHAMNPDTDLPQAFELAPSLPPMPPSQTWKTTEESEHNRLLKPSRLPTKKQLVYGALSQLPTAGGIAGGAGAVALTSPSGLGVIPARVAGAAFGAGTGEAIRQQAAEIIYPYDHRMTDEEKKRAIKIEAGSMAVAEAIPLVAGKVLTPIGKYYADTAAASEKAGFRMLPSEARGTLPTLFETYPKGSIFTANKMALWRKAQNQETEKAARDIADTISKKSLSKTGSREEAGKIIRMGFENHIENFSNSQKVIYDQIEKQADAAGVTVSRKEVVDLAQKELDRINRVRKTTGGVAPTDAFKKQLESIVKAKTPFAPYSDMKDFRSSILAESRSMNSLMSSPEKHFLSELSKTTGDAIEDGLKKSSNPNLAQMWRSANDATREEHKIFLEKLVENLAAKKNPEDIALVLRGNAPNAIAQIGIQETRDAMAVIPKSMIPRVQKQIILDTVYEATGKESKSFDEKLFARKMLQIGDERGEVLFGNNWSKIKEFSTLLNRLTESSGLTAAGLSNAGILNQVGRLAAESVGTFAGVTAAHGPAIMAAIVPVAGEAAMWKTIAAALTHPSAAARFIKGMQVLSRVVPTAAVATRNVFRGEKSAKQDNNMLDTVREKAKKLTGNDTNTTPQVTPPQSTDSPQTIGGQSSNKTHTHIWNPKTGQIEAV